MLPASHHAILRNMIKPDTNEELNPTEPIEAKAERRATVASLTEQFLSKGGIITKVAQGVSGEKDKPGLPKMIYGDAPEDFRR